MAKIEIEIEAKIDEAERALSDLEGQIADLQNTTEDYSKGNEQASLSLTDLKSGLDLAKQAVDTVGQFVEATAGKTAEYAAEVRNLSRDAGINAEESSKLIQAADDVGVSYDTLKVAAKKLNDEGIQPNIANLSRLADEYSAIQDPVQRAQFALDNFGMRAGPEMAKLLEQGSAGLKELAAGAEAAGLVMNDESVQAAREYEIALDGLNDATQAVTYSVGNQLIPVLTDAANAINTLVTWENTIEGALRTHAEEVINTDLTYQQYVDELNRAAETAGLLVNAEGDLVRVRKDGGRVTEEVVQSSYVLTEAERNAEAQLQSLAGITDRARDGFDGLRTAQESATLAAQAAQAAQGLLSTVYAEAEAALKTHNIGLAEQIDLEERLQLASGQITEADIARRDSIDFLTQQLSLGKISQDDYLAGIEAISTGQETTIGRTDDLGKAIANTGDTIENKFINKAKEMDKLVGSNVPVSLDTANQATKDYEKTLLEQMKEGGPIEKYIIGLSKITGEATAAANAIKNIPGIPNPGGGGGHGSVPGFAGGTDFAPGGLAVVGEHGPELVNLPRGSQVIPNNELGGGGTVIVQVDGQTLFSIMLAQGKANGLTMAQVA